MKLVDSNLIVYAINSDSPKSQSAQIFLKNNQAKLVVAQQNILESLRILTHVKFPHPMIIDNALRAVLDAIAGLIIIYPLKDTFDLFLELLRRYPVSSNNIFDVYLVSTMLSNGVDTIVTDNEKDFKFNGIKVINPLKGGYE